MSLLLASARLTASFRESATVLPLCTPRRTSDGSGGAGRTSTGGSTGSCGSWLGSAVGGTPSVGCAGLICGGVVTPEGGSCVPGGACGAGRTSAPGGRVGSTGRVRELSGTVERCSVPGGRVASRCAGVCGCGVAAGGGR